MSTKKKDGVSAKHYDTLHYRLTKFCSRFTDGILDIKSNHIDDWLRDLKSSARTRNNYRADIVSLFRFARTRGYLPKGLPTEVEDTKFLSESESEIEIFSVDELSKILSNCAEDIRPAVTLGAFAGLRTAEISRLKWEDIDFEANLIRVRAQIAKTKQRRLIPLLPNARALLLKTTSRTGLVSTHKRIDLEFAKIATITGIKWKHNALRHSDRVPQYGPDGVRGIGLIC